MQVNVCDAKTRLSQLIERALAGEEVIIARNGRAVVQIVPVRQTFPQPGFMKGMARFSLDAFRPMTEQEIREIFGCDS
jgi:prevent-host-death family protein